MAHTRSAGRVLRRSADAEVTPFKQIVRSFVVVFFLMWALAVFVLFRQREWHSPQQRGVVIVHSKADEVRQPLTLVITKPEKKVIFLQLPPEQLIETPFNYGTLSSDALVGLTQLEQLKWDYLLYTLSLEFGVGLDGIIWVEQPSISDLGELKGIALQTVLSRRPTTLAWWDRFTFWQYLQQVPSYQVQTVAVSEYLDEQKRLDFSRYDRWAELYLQDPAVRQSGFAVAVQNGSGITGYANRVSRMLGLLGYDVRNVETVTNQADSKLLWSDQVGSEQKWSQERIRQVFSPFKSETNAEVTSQARSTAVIQLGEDQGKLFMSE